MSESGPSRVTPSLAMQLLVAGVPLSLLVDLVEPSGPNSREIIDRERRTHRVGRRSDICVNTSADHPAEGHL